MSVINQVNRLVIMVLLLTGAASLSMGVAMAADGKSANYEVAINDLKILFKSSPDFKKDIEKVLRLQDGRSYYWDNKDVKYFINFFEEWLVYNPQPWDGPKYIQPFDELANSEGGDILFNNNLFSSWFIAFLDARGAYLSTSQSLPKEILKDWETFQAANMHAYKPPKNQKKYKSFIDVFLRVPKKPFHIDAKNDPKVMISPASGKIHQIYTDNLNSKFEVKKDVLNIRQALNNSPRAEKFIGGKMVDILLWFTDYHYFHAPITGTVVEVGEYAGSYNYNFQNVDWYKALAKHKRLCYIIDSEEFGLVAMIPVGFWGVGSIITHVKEGDKVTKGDLMGRFGYGGSSILLVFEPNAIDFTIKGIEKDWKQVKPGKRIGVAAK